ncbi:hypothetical protein DFJ74DRAFT_652828, partial [Hyaloraphidium curvatum]
MWQPRAPVEVRVQQRAIVEVSKRNVPKRDGGLQPQHRVGVQPLVRVHRGAQSKRRGVRLAGARVSRQRVAQPAQHLDAALLQHEGGRSGLLADDEVVDQVEHLQGLEIRHPHADVGGQKGVPGARAKETRHGGPLGVAPAGQRGEADPVGSHGVEQRQRGVDSVHGRSAAGVGGVESGLERGAVNHGRRRVEVGPESCHALEHGDVGVGWRGTRVRRRAEPHERAGRHWFGGGRFRAVRRSGGDRHRGGRGTETGGTDRGGEKL